MAGALQISPGNKPIKWRHPGVKPMQFVQRGIHQAKPIISNIAIDKTMRKIQAELNSGL